MAAYDQQIADEISKNQQAQQREADLAQREAQVQEAQARIFQQEADNLKMTVRSTVDPYVKALSEQFGVPVREIRDYAEGIKLNQFIDQATPQDLAMVGPMMNMIEVYAQQRGTQIAADNARRKTESGTYRAEGTGAGAGGTKVGVAEMPDKDFDALWEAVKRGNTASR